MGSADRGLPYTLLTTANGVLVGYHWHPTGRSHVATPHLHVRGAEPLLNSARAHLPIGHVTLATVVRWTIVEAGAEPRREDWASVLGAVEPALLAPLAA